MAIADKEFQKIKSTIKDFIEEEMVNEEKFDVKHTFEEHLPYLEEKRNKVRSLGLFTPQISKEYGGLGLSLYQLGQIYEILGHSFYGLYVFNCQAPDAGNMEILMDHGSDYQKDTFLKPLLSGDIRSCFSMTEPEFAGSNPTMMGTIAKKDGKNYVINGHKWFTSSAEGASFAIAMVVTDPDNPNPYLRASQIIVPTDTEGFKFIRNIPVMGDEGDGWNAHAEIRYENCTVPEENLLGKAGEGFKIAQDRLGPGRIHHCMRWVGECERMFDMMCNRALTRELAPNKPLATKQTIQNWIAESRAEINASRLMVLDTAKKIDEYGANSAKVEISTIKFYVANVLQNVLDRVLQVHGALGMTDDTPIALLYRHERAARIYDGADEVHKARVAREILKSYSK
ncbi:MAG: acyl-CoA dehydrogenase family protein [Candidatus Neomarinimicrobiota bacterium]|nr:acyl-CoA dehydrogenase family protein [Candidatus Neomarinimicrobiota bacterium]MEC9455571.1 acyl-CoA dehydrogenase family protein [Candidatus Neomarinimicrobiota bacterium]MED5451339.1 acyl-CoA dehydrogenase family protein [Candidatus Neomarinimicrobiota bacterium]MEE3301896.1 acyl-CoA dehydrogenase family protein [Candidatus Neomarinimicrobiota bacterium]